MRSAPTLKIWMTPLASVAMLEKLALLKIALCKAPVLNSASGGRAAFRPGSVTGAGGGAVDISATPSTCCGRPARYQVIPYGPGIPAPPSHVGSQAPGAAVARAEDSAGVVTTNRLPAPGWEATVTVPPS